MTTRFALVMGVVILALLACRPTPSDPVEYLHREDSIILQVLTLDEDAAFAERRLAVPGFTLYGDGTLIYQSVSADGTRLLQTSLPEDAVQKLIEDIVDGGFLDFTYDQPAPDGTSGETTFLYAHSLALANAVSAQGASAPLPEDAGDDFDEYRKVQTLIEMLLALDPATRGAGEVVAYVPERYLMLVQVLDGTGGFSERETSLLDAGLLTALFDKIPDPTLEDLAGPVALAVERGQDQAIYFAPLLPFHENFPEFELQ